MKTLQRWIPVVVAVAMSACASGGSSSKAAPTGASGVASQAEAAKPAKADPDVLTAEQLSKVGNVTVMRAVQVLRPAWLQARGVDNNDRDYQGMKPSYSEGAPSSTGGSILGVLDGEPLNDNSILWNMSVKSVYLVRHYDGARAISRWGARGSKGAIYVATSAAKAP